MGDKKIRILLLFHLNEHYIDKMEAMMTKDGEFDAGVIGYAYEMNHIRIQGGGAIPNSTNTLLIVLFTIQLLLMMLESFSPNNTQCTSQGIFTLGK